MTVLFDHSSGQYKIKDLVEYSVTGDGINTTTHDFTNVSQSFHIKDTGTPDIALPDNIFDAIEDAFKNQGLTNVSLNIKAMGPGRGENNYDGDGDDGEVVEFPPMLITKSLWDVGSFKSFDDPYAIFVRGGPETGMLGLEILRWFSVGLSLSLSLSHLSLSSFSLISLSLISLISLPASPPTLCPTCSLLLLSQSINQTNQLKMWSVDFVDGTMSFTRRPIKPQLCAGENLEECPVVSGEDATNNIDANNNNNNNNNTITNNDANKTIITTTQATSNKIRE